jgi:Na+-driven multidrug efflux pump
MIIILITDIIFFYLEDIMNFLLKTKVEIIRLGIAYLKIEIDEDKTI